MKIRKPKAVSYVKPLEELLADARAIGYRVHFVTSCFDAETPFWLAGKTCTERKWIWVSIKDKSTLRSEHEIRCILSHEIEHASGVMRATDYPEYGLCCGGFYEPAKKAS